MSASPPSRDVRVRENGVGRFQQQVTVGSHRLRADEPLTLGGEDAGPTPYELVLAALGACTSITLRMYAERKGWDIGKVRLTLTLFKDAEGATHIERELSMGGALDDAQWQRLLEIADKTPVTRTVRDGASIVTRRNV